MSCLNCIHNNVCYILKIIGEAGVGDHFFNPMEKLYAVCQHYAETNQPSKSGRKDAKNSKP